MSHVELCLRLYFVDEAAARYCLYALQDNDKALEVATRVKPVYNKEHESYKAQQQAGTAQQLEVVQQPQQQQQQAVAPPLLQQSPPTAGAAAAWQADGTSTISFLPNQGVCSPAHVAAAAASFRQASVAGATTSPLELCPPSAASGPPDWSSPFMLQASTTAAGHMQHEAEHAAAAAAGLSGRVPPPHGGIHQQWEGVPGLLSSMQDLAVLPEEIVQQQQHQKRAKQQQRYHNRQRKKARRSSTNAGPASVALAGDVTPSPQQVAGLEQQQSMPLIAQQQRVALGLPDGMEVILRCPPGYAVQLGDTTYPVGHGSYGDVYAKDSTWVPDNNRLHLQTVDTQQPRDLPTRLVIKKMKCDWLAQDALEQLLGSGWNLLRRKLPGMVDVTAMWGVHDGERVRELYIGMPYEGPAICSLEAALISGRLFNSAPSGTPLPLCSSGLWVLRNHASCQLEWSPQGVPYWAALLLLVKLLELVRGLDGVDVAHCDIKAANVLLDPTRLAALAQQLAAAGLGQESHVAAAAAATGLGQEAQAPAAVTAAAAPSAAAGLGTEAPAAPAAVAAAGLRRVAPAAAAAVAAAAAGLGKEAPAAAAAAAKAEEDERLASTFAALWEELLALVKLKFCDNESLRQVLDRVYNITKGCGFRIWGSGTHQGPEVLQKVYAEGDTDEAVDLAATFRGMVYAVARTVIWLLLGCRPQDFAVDCTDPATWELLVKALGIPRELAEALRQLLHPDPLQRPDKDAIEAWAIMDRLFFTRAFYEAHLQAARGGQSYESFMAEYFRCRPAVVKPEVALGRAVLPEAAG